MNVLLLGGTGAIGKMLVDMLAERKDTKVYVTSRKKRHSSNEVTYIYGNALDDFFLLKTLDERRYDCVIDFMVYRVEQFEKRINLILPKVEQYIFISTARVYADSKVPIHEDSDRLLDVCQDHKFVKSNAYAIAKAKEENILTASLIKNWTIVRPYITYNDNRLQLCNFEKEQWLVRALRGKTVVVGKDILKRHTSLTYAYDVAYGINKLVNNNKALGEVFHIVNESHCSWNKILELYKKYFKKYTGYEMKIKCVNDSNMFSWKDGDDYVVKYDRLYDRIFDSSKINAIIGNYKYTTVDDGINSCFTKFVNINTDLKYEINWALEGFLDKITKEREHVFPTSKDKITYICFRYFPLSLANCLRKLYRNKMSEK